MGKEIVFFSQFKLGGVQSYYKQIISNDPYGTFSKSWILTRDQLDPAALPPSGFDICPEHKFEYLNSDPTVFKRLSKLISGEEGIIMTNFHLELTTLSRYPRQKKTVLHVCHDDFFLEIACGFAYIIDAFVAHNKFYFEKLQQLLPGRKEDIYYLPYGISPSPYFRSSNEAGPLKIFFLARFDKKKGVYDLFDIDDHLVKAGVRVMWTLVGDGPEKEGLRQRMAARDNFQLLTIRDSEDVFREAAKNDIFILPSYLDGLPVALLETMSAGLVPVISEFNKGIRSVVNDEVGYVLPVGDNKSFADCIARLNGHRALLDSMGARGKDLIQKTFHIKDRSRDYYDLFSRYKTLKRTAWYKFKKHLSPGRVDYFRFMLNRKRKAIFDLF